MYKFVHTIYSVIKQFLSDNTITYVCAENTYDIMLILLSYTF